MVAGSLAVLPFEIDHTAENIRLQSTTNFYSIEM
jgi:hypothetical protein